MKGKIQGILVIIALMALALGNLFLYIEKLTYAQAVTNIGLIALIVLLLLELLIRSKSYER